MRFTDMIHAPALPDATAETLADVFALAAEACHESGQTERADGLTQAANIVRAMREPAPGTRGTGKRGAADWMFAIDPENPLPTFH